MRERFAGYYLKHQKDCHTLCLIAGQSGGYRFLQIITDDASWEVPLDGGASFSLRGICLNIDTPQISIKGKIGYGALSPIKYDIMGPFCLFPMECRHGIVSMRHRLRGQIWLNGKMLDFTDGIGYIEKDSGSSFPSSYTWIHANDFKEPCAVMAAVADIPFFGFHFRGCICIVQYRGKEYRLATYLGVRVLECTANRILLVQGKYRLEIRIKRKAGHALSAPRRGRMSRTIHEAAACPAQFRFFVSGKQLFCLNTRHASFEQEEADNHPMPCRSGCKG